MVALGKMPEISGKRSDATKGRAVKGVEWNSRREQSGLRSNQFVSATAEMIQNKKPNETARQWGAKRKEGREQAAA